METKTNYIISVTDRKEKSKTLINKEGENNADSNDCLGKVGGVLAFKAKRIGFYCTAAILSGGSTKCSDEKCPNGTIWEFGVPLGVSRCFKVTMNTAYSGSANLNCTSNQTFTAD